ncbi:MAG: tetratricopeptide repeat protein [Gemmatimonadetes bacterium]|nr:tetratricopeptide repeat protein [Gemmatimonadota bacterium]MDA1102367.1 tetratricopeptide repeat protein [Gemmatimonadota bacterium]
MRRCIPLASCWVVLFAPLAAAQDVALPPGFEDPMPLHHDGKGLGPFSRDITTSSHEAQLYFDQGVQLLYAFAPRDAARSFREAWKRDANCAMCYFGEAWAWGPYLNGPMTAPDAPRAHAAIQKALELSARNANDVERALISAMAGRYEVEHDADRRRELDGEWAEAINALYKAFPHDLEAGFLAGESLMLLQPRRGTWDVHDPEIQEIHRVLESVLAQDITHPGSCHLYIHATEPTQEPGRAEACANYLGASIPGASHIQHMPSHTFNRIGRWGDAVRANTDAWHSDLKAAYGEGFAIYPSHNLHMLLFAASNDGQGAVAIQAGRDYAELMEGASFYEALTMLRFGRFEDIIGLQNPPDGTVFRGLWDFAKGYAHLRSDDEGTARWYLHRVKTAVADDPDDAFRGHTATQLLGVVGAILEGEILRASGDLEGAIEVLTRGGEVEDGLRYDEPEPLNFSVYTWLGDALHEAGRHAESEAAFRHELVKHPHNGWSLFGLERALRAQGKHAMADETHQEFRSAWARADTYIRSPIF